MMLKIDSSYADMTFSQQCLRVYFALYVTLYRSVNVLLCVKDHSAIVFRMKQGFWTACP
jgi:hypothetical protein